ncbi:hypothetical protein COV24_03910 [candidate division WWE3 bacterium CG10_big_fil_rev_8_21_14_0_10_32_10]|uniref:Helix-turn-helix domain-containing protein n=1 Tax=candidate division WWE3 bacterium CG10_big_fil_rev_8_21_14_0_10_32_10 TaxID=1975090 RepID=A0A2H0R9K5_UNCKA|nr:MAG: hypothetical protein COV24_03910 [candidate division WWE3 bacterium CG10_big_fil_rev_8_21_14_0_10_32_10]
MELEDRFFKSTEVADILGVSLRTLYRYMDSQKIDSVQLPSGRHRFTKKQIEGFLYSSGEPLMQNIPNNSQDSGNRIEVNTGMDLPQIKQSDSQTGYNKPSQEPNQSSAPASTQETEEEDLEKELDALLKSLESEDDEEEISEDFIDKEEEPQNVLQSEPQVVAPVQNESVSPTQSSNFSSASSILEETKEVEPTNNLDENEVHYFYCPYNELRAIARIIKKTADDNNKTYAFTLNAGISLYFPLDPFSLIHFYIAKEDLDFWKENLQLRESSTADANLGVLLTSGPAFENLQEVSGLKVVSKAILMSNLRSVGNNSLLSEVENKM